MRDWDRSFREMIDCFFTSKDSNFSLSLGFLQKEKKVWKYRDPRNMKTWNYLSVLSGTKNDSNLGDLKKISMISTKLFSYANIFPECVGLLTPLDMLAGITGSWSPKSSDKSGIYSVFPILIILRCVLARELWKLKLPRLRNNGQQIWKVTAWERLLSAFPKLSG